MPLEGFLYGTDTVPLNLTEMARLETTYRGVIKNMLAVPDYTATCAVYLPLGPSRQRLREISTS